MSTGHHLDAVWAISSKKPAQAQGHRTTCEPEDSNTAGRLVILAEHMGTPEGPRIGCRDELPWVSFAGGGERDQPMVAVASIEWSDERDGTEQPIAPVRLVWLPWAAVAEGRFGYLSLRQAVAQLHWPEVDAGPGGAIGHRIVLTVPPPDQHLVVDQVSRDFNFLAQIAAHLVDGRRVAIVLDQGDAVTTPERLLLLDAVMALLPFGARNCLTVATWASYKAAQEAVLTFSDGLQPNQVGVPWRGDRELALAGDLGRDYMRELYTAVEEGYDFATIVNHLASKTEPLTSVDERTIDVLRDLRFGSILYEKVLRGEGSVDDVRRALGEGNPPDKHVREFVRFLAVSACSADSKERKEAGEVIVARWTPTSPMVLGQLCRDGQPGVEGQEGKWLSLSQEAEKTHPGAAADYLAHALRLPEVRPEDQEMAALATLTVQYLAKAKSIDEKTYENLVAQPHVLVQALSATLLSGNSKVQRIAARLKEKYINEVAATLRALQYHAESTGPSWPNPILLASKGKADLILAQDVEALTEVGPKAVSCLVDLLVYRAGARRSIDITWPAVTRLLTVHGVEKTRDVLNGLLAAPNRKRDELPAAHKARMDLLCLLSNEPPRYQDLLESGADGYLDTVRQELSTLNPALVTLVTQKLIEHLDRRFDSVPPDVVRRLDEALGIGLTQQYLDTVAQWLKQGRLRTVLDLDLPTPWQHDLEARPELAWYRALRKLNVLVTADTDVADVLGKTVDALHPSAEGEVVRALRVYVDRAHAGAVEELLWQLHNDKTASKRVASKVRQHLLTSGSGAARTFVSHVNERLAWYNWLSQLEGY